MTLLPRSHDSRFVSRETGCNSLAITGGPCAAYHNHAEEGRRTEGCKIRRLSVKGAVD